MREGFAGDIYRELADSQSCIEPDIAAVLYAHRSSLYASCPIGRSPTEDELEMAEAALARIEARKGEDPTVWAWELARSWFGD